MWESNLPACSQIITDYCNSKTITTCNFGYHAAFHIISLDNLCLFLDVFSFGSNNSFHPSPHWWSCLCPPVSSSSVSSSARWSDSTNGGKSRWYWEHWRFYESIWQNLRFSCRAALQTGCLHSEPRDHQRQFQTFPQAWVISSCSVQAHNALFAAGAQTYFLRMNQFGDRTLEEISAEYTGLGLLSSAPASLAPSQVTQGQLPVNYNPPRSVDTEGGCRTAVTEEQQQWFRFLMAYIPEFQFITFLILFPTKIFHGKVL